MSRCTPSPVRRRGRSVVAASVAVFLLASAVPFTARALTVDFDVIVTTQSFVDAELTNFLGFFWSEGWGSNHVSAPLTASPVLGVSGETSAANISGAQRLRIDFAAPTDVRGGFFRQLAIDGMPAASLRLIGLDASGAVIADTEVRALAPTWRFLPADFEAVSALEIEADAPGRFFGVDDLLLDPEALDLIRAAVDLVFVLDDTHFAPRGRDRLLRRLEWAERAAEAGWTRSARRILGWALERADGCALRGEADGPGRHRPGPLRRRGAARDWLVDCVDQVDLYDLLSDGIDALEERRPRRFPWRGSHAH